MTETLLPPDRPYLENVQLKEISRVTDVTRIYGVPGLFPVQRS